MVTISLRYVYTGQKSVQRCNLWIHFVIQIITYQHYILCTTNLNSKLHETFGFEHE